MSSLIRCCVTRRRQIRRRFGSMTWSTNDIPDLSGRIAVVTGANGGLGLASAKALAAKGAHVVMAARDQDKAARARDEILADYPSASLEIVELDLGSLASVEAAADTIAANARSHRHPHVQCGGHGDAAGRHRGRVRHAVRDQRARALGARRASPADRRGHAGGTHRHAVEHCAAHRSGGRPRRSAHA